MTTDEMKVLLLLVVCASLALVAETEFNGGCMKSSENGAEGVEACDATNYEVYVECARRRMKRAADCNKGSNSTCSDCEDNSCQKCDCEFCAVNSCDSSCDTCCPNNPPCRNNRCCHKTCHSRCKTLTCRTECRRNCVEKVAIAPGNPPSEADKPRHNITTIIDLHNIINNTNEIQIPIQINNTNYNNFTQDNSGDGHTTVGETNSEPCCQIMSQRQCVPMQEYPFVKCFRLRKKACGNFCEAPIMLEQPHDVCEPVENGTKCHQELVYVAQPQPSCSFQPYWPFVSCGAQSSGQYFQLPTQPAPPSPCLGGCSNVYNWGAFYPPGTYYGQAYNPVPPSQNGGYYPYNYGNAYSAYPVPYNGPPGVYPPYSPFSFSNPVQFQTISAPAPNDSASYVNKKEVPPNPVPIPSYQYQYQYPYQPPPQPLPPWQFYYPVQMTPLGYQYQTPVPLYYLPPEVNIQASVSQPEKDGRYAQITITDKRETETNESKEKAAYETATRVIAEM